MTALRQDVAPDGTTVLRSSRIEAAGFSHAFSTRIGPGGTTDPGFDLSRPGFSPIDMDPAESTRNLEHFARLLHSTPPIRPIASPRQVHGPVVVDPEVADQSEADVVVSLDPNRIAAIRTADCVGILLACPKTGAVAAIHSGWRGLVADAPGAAVRALVERFSAEPTRILAAIGPAIGSEVYEVGPEVAEIFQNNGLGGSVVQRMPKPHLDLHSAAIQRLTEAKIQQSMIEGKPLCTHQDPRFFSYRGDGPASGRLMAGIIARPEEFSKK
jgi:hypothetical protein